MIKCPKCGMERPDWQPYCGNIGAGCLDYKCLISFPEEGGTFSEILGFKYPYPGFPEQYALGQNATVKRVLISTIRFLGRLFKFGIVKNVIYWLAEIYEPEYAKYQVAIGGENGKKFCKSGREILRVGLLLVSEIKDEEYKKRATQLVYFVVMMWEMDAAYRFRGQDVFTEFNKDNLRKNVRKEVLRVFRTGLSRESTDPYQHHKYQIIVNLLSFVLFVMPKTKCFIKRFLLELDLDEIKPTIADLYYMARYFDYKFAGLTLEVRTQWKENEDRGYIPPQINARDIANISFQPNDFFYELDRVSAIELIEKVKIKMIEDYTVKAKI